MEEKKEPRSAIVHHGPQAQDKSCSRGLVMTWFLPRPWPARPWCGIVYSPWGGICEGGVGCTGVVWDVQPIGFFWLCKEVRPLQAGYGCRAIATIPPLASPQKSLAFKEIRPERRGVVAGRSLPYLRFRARKRNNVDDVHETPRFQNIANTLVFLMFPVTPCKRVTSPRD